MKYRLLLLSIGVALAVIWTVHYRSGYMQDHSENMRPINSMPADMVIANQKMQQLGLLSERLNRSANYRPTTEELEDDNRYFQERVAAIGVALPGHDLAQRLKATEQLGAYPIPEAVELLSVILETDQDPAVRQLAAQTLGGLEPDTRSINALLGAFVDSSEPVKSASLLSLELLLQKPRTKAQREQIIRGLERVARERPLSPRLYANLTELLSDQQPID